MDINEKLADISIVGNDVTSRANSYGAVQTPEQMLKRAYSYAAICADKQASFIASQPLRLYRRINGKNKPITSKAHTSRKLDASKLAHLKSTSGVGVKTAIWAEQAGEIEEIMDADILKLLHKPNETMLGTDFAYALAWQRAITGNSFIYLETKRNQIVSLNVMFPQYVTLIIEDGVFLGYQYGKEAAEVYQRDEVLHQKYRPSRNSSLYGESPLHSCIIAADILINQNCRELMFYENDCRPSFVIKVPAETSPQQMVDTENRFNSKFRGYKNNGKFVVLKDSEITPLGFAPKDLEGANLRREIKQEIFSAYGISESEFAMNDANLASSTTGNLQFFRNIKPLLIKNAEEYTSKLIPYFYPNSEDGEYFLAYDEILPAAAKPQLSPAERVALGVVTINEMRSEMGLPPIEGGDALRFQGQPINAAPQPVASISAQDAEAAISAALEQSKTIETKGYSVTDGMVEEANRGLAWREEYGRGGTEVGVARARDISNRRELSEDTVMRMVSYFARHEVDKQAQGWNQGEEGYPSAGRIAWALWGGDDGRTWANNIADSLDGKDAKSASTSDIIEKSELEIPSAEERVNFRKEIWRSKKHMDVRTETKYAKLEIDAAIQELIKLYQDLAKQLNIKADGTIDMKNFDKRLAVKLFESLMPSFTRGAEDGLVRLRALTPNVELANIDFTTSDLANYVVRLSRQITEMQQEELNNVIREAVKVGDSPQKITADIKQALNEQATYKAERIARTETAKIYVEGQTSTWRAAGVKRVVPILAPNSCTICREQFNKYSETGLPVETGSDAIWHPQCRCDVAPILE